MKTALCLPLGLLFLAVLACGGAGKNKSSTPSTGPGSSDTPITVTATQLVKDYTDNEVRADEKYKNKTLIVSGTIQNIGKDLSDTPYITIKSGDAVRSVQVYFTDSGKLGSLNTGASVTVKGRCDGLLMNVQMKDAVLQ